MIQIMKRYITLAFIALMIQNGAFGQVESLPSRSMTIEGNYNPSMTNAEKIMPVPAKQNNDKEPAVVSYLTEPSPFNNAERTPMNVFSESSDGVYTDSFNGIARFGYGLRNIMDGLFDFGWRMTESDEVKFSGLLGGWNSEIVDWKSKMLDGSLKVGYTHKFESMDMGISLSYGLSDYNFRGGAKMTDAIRDASNLTMKTNSAGASASLSGKIDKISWHGKGGVEWLSRDGFKVNGVTRDNREMLLRLDAGVSMPLGFGTVGLEYKQKSAFYDWTGMKGIKYDNFSTFTLSPYWNISKGSFMASLGANIDLRTAVGDVFLASPMINIAYGMQRFTLHAGVTGGLEEYDVKSLNRISPYWTDEDRIRDGYTVYNANIGLSYSSDTWLSMDLSGGFRHTIDEAFQVTSDDVLLSSAIRQQTADVLYGRMDIDMQFSDMMQVRMDVTYNNYLNVFKDGKMELKPAFDANAYGRFSIMRGLDATLSYRLMIFHRVNRKSMPTVNDVALTINYNLTRNLSVYAEGSHLLGGDFYYYAGYRTLAPAGILGLSYRF